MSRRRVTLAEALDALRRLVNDADSDHWTEPDDSRVVVMRETVEQARAVLTRATATHQGTDVQRGNVGKI